MSKNKVCIILPCFRVKHKIYTVYKKLISQKIDCLIFVDDNCPQKSVKYLKSRISTNKKVQFIFLRKNLGVGGATLKGFKSAFDQGYDLILKFDSDNQHKIIDLTKIIKKLKEPEVYFCKGYRNLTLKDSIKRKMPLIRTLGASALTVISKITTSNYDLKDVTNGLFGMKSEVLRKVNLKNIKQNYFFEQDLIFRISLKKIKIHQINSEVIYDNETSSLKILKTIIPFLFYHFQNILKR
ncbi:glycosyltransferase family 2 protein [Candidatus Pelagibacter sp.]|jgi:dolichol-phosphate mannosyltransferase|nr:glycosyltransferase family 2 protein [Candidatus Pelagibacter sp.]